MSKTKIEWTDGGETWNPVRGCSRVSPGCEHCYAERQAIRHAGAGDHYEGLVRVGKHGPVWTGVVKTLPEKLAEPLGWKRPRKVFVNSMSDLFHERVPFEFIAAVFGVCAATPRHVYQILTKRSRRMREFFAWLAGARDPRLRIERCLVEYSAAVNFRDCRLEDTWPLHNVWLGVSAEDQQRADERIPELLLTPAAVRFVSYEPALGPVDFLRSIARAPSTIAGQLVNKHLQWVIVGGESGPGARPFDIEWAESVLEQCQRAGVACFVKQLGPHPYQKVAGASKEHHVEDVKGGRMEEWPAHLRVRQYPEARA
jgi:protein gp37